MPFDFDRAMRLKRQRRVDIQLWKDLRYKFDLEHDRSHIRKLDMDEALEDAIAEMSQEEIVLLVRRLANALICK